MSKLGSHYLFFNLIFFGGIISQKYIYILKSALFAMVPGSSINSWDSWFIFNLRKNKHLLLHDIFVHGKRQRECLLL
jgi:hypothetical protein